MPATTAYYFSLLMRQLALGEEAFLRRHPNSWLVWEAGGTPGHLTDVSLSVLDTNGAELRRGIQRPSTGDSLCFALKELDGEPLRIGRDVGNQLVIADPTVSRVHAQLDLKAGGWRLTPLSERRTTLVTGRVADPGISLPLVSGATVELGGVKLAFYDAKAFKALVGRVPLRGSR